jgi:phosphoglycerate dehydrogenase-like enzyme
MWKALYLLDPKWQRIVYPESVDRELAPWVEFVGPPQSAAAIRANPALLHDAEIVFTGWGMAPLTAEMLAHAPRLRAVFHAAGSVRYFMTAEAWSRGLVVSTGHAINALPVAEYTLAAILFGLRRGWHYAARLKAERNLWYQSEMPGGYGSTVALISFGAVGRLVRERLRPFDVRVVAHDPFLSANDAAALDLESVSLADAFHRADVVSLHTPLLPETTGLIRAEHFAAMKSGATFINTARGAVVAQMEMIEVLRARPDLHAVLDVTDPEPPPRDSPLFELPNVTLTPHIAGTCQSEAPRLGRAMIDEFHRWRQNRPLRYGVTAASAARMA